ncbi:MAG: zf-HC2 domain-containing protein [Bacillota bacterium]|nr:zf-HC2 domain-containing protein [Bacillota bacterium]
MSGPEQGNAEEEERIRERLPFYVAGTLSPAERQEVELHLASCVLCRRELQLWREIAGAVAAETAELGEPAASRRPLASPLPVALRQRWALLAAQARLGGWLFWLTPLLLGGVGALLAGVVGRNPAVGWAWLLWVAPLLPAAGMAALDRWEDGRLYELVATTATGPRRQALARLALVFAYDAALVAALAAWLPGAPAALGLLAGQVLAPMALVLGVAFLASVLTSAGNALAASTAVWVLVRMAAVLGQAGPGDPAAPWVEELARVAVAFLGSGWAWVVAAALVGAGLYLAEAPRRLEARRVW